MVACRGEACLAPTGAGGEEGIGPGAVCGRGSGVTLWSKQQEVLEALARERRVAVKSGNGLGKDFTAAVAVLWYLNLPRPGHRAEHRADVPAGAARAVASDPAAAPRRVGSAGRNAAGHAVGTGGGSLRAGAVGGRRGPVPGVPLRERAGGGGRGRGRGRGDLRGGGKR